jgi:uncharacterized protein
VATGGTYSPSKTTVNHVLHYFSHFSSNPTIPSKNLSWNSLKPLTINWLKNKYPHHTQLPDMHPLVRVEPIALFPTPNGCAVFLGDGMKCIVFYIDPALGAAINAGLTGQVPSRPLTHDLFSATLQAFGANISRAIIVRMENDVYYARLILEAENEIMERKIIEIDARPSDCLALTVRCNAPLYVVKTLWDSLRNMTDVLDEMKLSAEQGNNPSDLGIL